VASVAALLLAVVGSVASGILTHGQSSDDGVDVRV